MQNLLPGAHLLPHSGQNAATGCGLPQFIQNFAPSATGEPHSGQTLPAGCAGAGLEGYEPNAELPIWLTALPANAGAC